MHSTLRINPIEVINRLTDLGLKREDLIEVIERMVSARNSCTANHPPGSAGWMAWSEGTCRLRDVFLPLGWEKCEDYHISSVWDRKQMQIAVSNTDDGTGLENRQPQQRSKKGAGTDRIVASNQSVFPEILEESMNVIQLPQAAGATAYWYLCVYAEGEVVRAELSCPSLCGNGFFTAFHERIILIGEDSDGGTKLRHDVPDDGEGFEITVTRKSAS